MRLLFVKLKHIGDSLLLTPALTAVRRDYPDAEIHVVVRRGCEGILAGCPAIDRLHTASAPEADNRVWWWDWTADARLLLGAWRRRFDYAFELSDGNHSRGLVWLSGARQRCANTAGKPLNWWWRQCFNRTSKFSWYQAHRVEKDFRTINDCLPLAEPVPPLAFARNRCEAAPRFEGINDFVVIHPGTRWKRKRWPVEKWRELSRWLLGRVSRIIISGGPSPDEVALAGELTQTLGDRVISAVGQVTWPQMAGLLYRARLFVGVDTAAMHLSAACQCPTVAIFGPSEVPQWRPWRVAGEVITPDAAALAGLPPENQIQAVPTDAVTMACRRLLSP